MKFLRMLFRTDRVADTGDVPSVDITPQLKMQREARARADRAANVRGKHYLDWVPRLNELRSAGPGKETEYLQLVLEVIEAAERSSAVHHLSPPNTYTKRAAIIYRRRKDYLSEIAILERYDQACRTASSGRYGAGADLTRLLDEAKRLHNRWP